MAQEQTEVKAEETEAQKPAEEQAAQAAEQEASAENQDAQADEAAQAEAEAEAKKKEEEEKKKQRQKRRSKLITRLLLVLLLLVLLFEAAMGFLWWRYDAIAAEQEAQGEQTSQSAVQRRVTNSAYANWGGTYRPIDWPEAVDAFASIPDYKRLEPGTDGAGDPAEQPEDAATGQ